MDSQPFDPTSRLVALDAEGLIAADLPCNACGYLLRMRSPDDVCPECGAAIRETLNASNIRLLPLDWLRRIQAAAVCLAIAIPTTYLFGLGVFAWLLGVLTLVVEAPKSRPEFKRLQRIIGVSGIVAAITIVSLFALADTFESAWPAFVHAGVLACALGVHFAGVLRYAARVCDDADWPTMKKLGNGLALFGLVWPGLAVGSIVLLGMSFSYAWGGTAPAWLDPLLIAVGVPAFFGGMAFALTQFIFWIVLAVRMRRIRREAAVMYREARGLAERGRRV
ncbi:MAG: hypothetical protein AAF086_09390 [Planctomycetota bacterium]